jgi:single-strand DNA-binding protein
MSRGLNKVMIIGTLGKDPELKYTPSGMAIAKMRVAVSESFKSKDGQRQEKTEWFNVVAFQRTAEIAGEYLHKGGQVYIEGKLQTREYDDKQGQKKYFTEVVANQMLLLGGKPRGEAQGGGEESQDPPKRGGFQRGQEPSSGDSLPAQPEADDFPPQDYPPSPSRSTDDDEVPF